MSIKIKIKKTDFTHFTHRKFALLLIINIFLIHTVFISHIFDLFVLENRNYLTDDDERLKLSNPGPQLSFYSFQVDDGNSGSSQGDDDGNIDAGETIELRLTLQNTGDEDALNVNATLTSTDNNITISNGFQEFVIIPQGSTGISASFYVFNINSSCSANYNLTLDLEINSTSGGLWYDNFEIEIIGWSNPVYNRFSVVTESDGDLIADHDGVIDPGEIIDFDIYVKNLGGANIYGLTGLIEETDPFIIIDDNSGNYGNINSNGGTANGGFGIIVSGSCPDKRQIDINFTLTDNEGTTWYLTLFLIVNGTSDYEIIDFIVIEYDGDGDEFVDAGEIWYANITIKNNGTAIGHSIYALLDSVDSYLSFYHSSRNRGYGDINVNTTVSYSSSSYWRFNISSSTPNGNNIWFTVNISDNSEHSNWIFKITLNEGTNNITIQSINESECIQLYSFDSDGDGLIDWEEENIYSTDPNDSDSDDDGLTDGQEVNTFFTDPNNPDTDDDGYSDGEEVFYGNDPLDPSSNPYKTIITIQFSIIIVIIIIIGSVVLIYVRKRFFSSRKQKGKEESELTPNKFENFLRTAKDFVSKGKNFYSKEAFTAAIDSWKDSVHNYGLALEKAPTSEEKKKIIENQKNLSQSICQAYIEKAKQHDKIAKKSHKGKNLTGAEKDWNLSSKAFQMAIGIIKSEKFEIDYKLLEEKVKSIELNLKQNEIEKKCLETDKKLERARSLQDKDLAEATKIANEAVLQYSEAKSRAEKYPEFQELVRRIETKMINTRNFQSQIQDKLDELIGISAPTTKVIIDEFEDKAIGGVETVIKAEKREEALSIVREYEFIGGQIRFKCGLINNTRTPLTNFKINFDIPDALKWIMHEPNYERRGDSILIAKLGINEKKAVSLYLEPINCMKSSLNATVSFFDAKDRPQAVPMRPKEISITCPIFFTEEEANLARVKSLHRTLEHCDRKVFPLINIEKISFIYSSALNVLGEYDIKLIYKEFSDKDKFGEAWFYGITKVKKNRVITYILLNGEENILELEVSGESEEQITAFLAEIGNKIREQLIKQKVLSKSDRFYDIRISILSSECPFCGGKILAEEIQKYQNGQSITCQYCKKLLVSLK